MALTAFAVYEVVVHELAPLVLAFLLLPDAAALAGVSRPHQPGQLPPRAVPAYNLAHQPMLPLVVVALAVSALLAARLLTGSPGAFEAARRIPLYVFTAAVAWLAHVAWDRAFGFGLRTPDGWQRGGRRR